MKRSPLTSGPRLLSCLHHPSNRRLPSKCPPFRRKFQTSTRYLAIRTQKLGDVGEGITECMLNMWFVEEGACVEEWDKLCEMQSDKAAVEISVNYAGVVKKLYAQADDMVKTGAPLVDIDDGLAEEEDFAAETSKTANDEIKSTGTSGTDDQEAATASQVAEKTMNELSEPAPAEQRRKMPVTGSFLATPAVRGLLKEHNVDISEVKGSGKDGRVLKEDVQEYVKGQEGPPRPVSPPRSVIPTDSKQVETEKSLSPIQTQMFRTMTASLAIPHFLYTDEVHVTNLSDFRISLNRSREEADPKITLLSFIVKAVSMSLNQHPLLNARTETIDESARPLLMYRSIHNVGIAMDTPAGLLVPVVKNVGALSILDIAHEIRRLSELGKAKKLSSTDLSGGTITVSNIGSIGGTVVAPVIVEGQVAILGVGKSRSVPIFGENDSIEKAEVANFSWSADHRIVDGATMARMADLVKRYIEEPERLMVQMR